MTDDEIERRMKDQHDRAMRSLDHLEIVSSVAVWVVAIALLLVLVRARGC